MSDKAAEVMRMFGVTADMVAKEGLNYSCKLDIRAGDVVYITGPSGAGKSVLLRELEKSIPHEERVNLDEIPLPADKAVIDCVEGDFFQSLKLLSIAGLNDVFCVLKAPADLSEGQKYRFRLAVALASGRKFIFADEFCSNLDRVTAAVISYNIRRFAKRMGVTFILAGSSDDVPADLQADVLVERELGGGAEVIYKSSARQKSMGDC